MGKMANVKPRVAWNVTVETNIGGSTLMVAQPTWEHASGEWESAASLREGNPFRDLEDFRVSMYLRSYSSPDTPDLFGLGYQFESSRVQLRDAERMVRVLRKLDRKMGEFDSQEGYVGNDFTAYLVRVGRVLGVGGFRVRCTAKQRETHGEWFRATDAAGLQYWVTDRVADGGAALRARV